MILKDARYLLTNNSGNCFEKVFRGTSFFAMAVETLQLFTIDRQANIMDFFINMLGIVVAAALLFIRMLIIYKRQEK